MTWVQVLKIMSLNHHCADKGHLCQNGVICVPYIPDLSSSQMQQRSSKVSNGSPVESGCEPKELFDIRAANGAPRQCKTQHEGLAEDAVRSSAMSSLMPRVRPGEAASRPRPSSWQIRLIHNSVTWLRYCYDCVAPEAASSRCKALSSLVWTSSWVPQRRQMCPFWQGVRLRMDYTLPCLLSRANHDLFLHIWQSSLQAKHRRNS